MSFEVSSIKKRVAGLLLALPLMLVLCVVAYKFGPSPTGNAGQAEPTTAPELQRGKAESSQSANAQLFDLFGMYQAAVAKGRVQVGPQEYLNSIEALYRQRGYAKLDTNDRSPKRRKLVPRSAQKTTGKFFEREQSDGIGSISAIGYDADYGTDQQSPEPFSFSTLVVPAENGGAEWATYRMEIDRSKLEQLANLKDGDFPGADPANIPRPQGLRRIYAFASVRGSIAMYKSMETEAALTVHYLDEMPRRGWRLEPGVISNANTSAHVVMCFTKAQAFAMIWVTTDKDTGATNVTVSSH
jgi:hypothetical protein